MERRNLLAGVAGGLFTGLSGCLEAVQEQLPGNQSKQRTLGEPVEHRGISVTPDAFTIARNVKYDVADTTNTVSRTAPQGATYLFTHITVEHIGENQRVFPLRGGFARGDDIRHFYKGERLDDTRFADISTAFILDNNHLPNYIQVLVQKSMVSAIYSGKASGWLINEIPEGFTRSEVTVKIEWGGSSRVSDDENQQEFTWSLTTETEVTPNEAGNMTSSSGTIIQA